MTPSGHLLPRLGSAAPASDQGSRLLDRGKERGASRERQEPGGQSSRRIRPKGPTPGWSRRASRPGSDVKCPVDAHTLPPVDRLHREGPATTHRKRQSHPQLTCTLQGNPEEPKSSRKRRTKVEASHVLTSTPTAKLPSPNQRGADVGTDTDRVTEPRNERAHAVTRLLTRRPRPFDGERRSLDKCFWDNWTSTCESVRSDPYPRPRPKSNSKSQRPKRKS